MNDKIIPLVMPCPTGCGNQTTVKNWVHAKSGCGAQIFLKGNGCLLCLNGCGESSMCDWRFACEKYQGDYRKIDFNCLVDALGCALRSTKDAFFNTDQESLLFLAGIHAHICSRIGSFI